MFYVYVLECADGSFYTGHTEDLNNRLSLHDQAAFPFCYTAQRLPVSKVFHQQFDTLEQAVEIERKVKGCGPQKMQDLLRGHWQQLTRESLKNHAV